MPSPAAPEAEPIGVYTVQEFSAAFKISRGMLYKLKKSGRLKISKIGTRSVVTRAEAQRFLRTLETDAA